MIQEERIETLNGLPPRKGRYVLYWMQQAQRAEWNHALEFALDRANEIGVPMVALFALTDGFPEANLRHYAFMLEGLRETAARLERRGIRFVLREGPPPDVCIDLAGDAALVVTDAGRLRIQKQWRRKAAKGLPCALIQVESDVVVPLELVSGKEEYAARTIRPKIHKLLERFLVPLRTRKVKHGASALRISGLDVDDVDGLLKKLRLNVSVRPVESFKGGPDAAGRFLREFVNRKLAHYDDRRNDPSLDYCSHMSPYLHFGQISALNIALEVMKSGAPCAARDAYIEELIVRRELSMNFVHYNAAYDAYAGLPAWARRTLASHLRDRREHLYGRDELDNALTHDPYWNAAQIEMAVTGKMHNYMRMYWGKKIIEWSPTPEEAFDTAVYLNNKYELDGRDANSFTGVAWCFGRHDRPWTERPVFGQVRYMNAAGLERKFEIRDYVRKVEELSGRKLIR